MRSFIRYTIAALCCAAAAWVPAPARGDMTHPIVGAWQLLQPDAAECAERYVFRPDGTAQFSSGHEQGESRYRIEDTAGSGGFYAISDVVTGNNGLADCSGASVAVGDRVDLFVRFIAGTDTLVMCESASLDRCFAMLVRIGGAS